MEAPPRIYLYVTFWYGQTSLLKVTVYIAQQSATGFEAEIQLQVSLWYRFKAITGVQC